MSPEWSAAYLEANGLSKDFPERFISKVDFESSENGCWLWLGGLAKGYGYLKKGNRPNKSCIVASRASWILFVGPIPENQSVLHDCPGGDNRICVNPDHLWLGTLGENCIDTFDKARSTFGERHWNHKLTAEQVTAIRSMCGTMKQIGILFGISAATVCNIKHYDSWNHPSLQL
jgi:hypothetical protein